MGGGHSFDPIIRAHQGAVRAFLRRLTGETMRADELAQEVFIKAYRLWPDIPAEPSLRAWLYKIAYRRFLDEAKKTQRRASLSDAAPEAPDRVYTAPGLRIDIARAMDALPPERRACALLGLAQGHSHGEVAAITGLPLGTVKSHIARARTVLMEQLNAYAR